MSGLLDYGRAGRTLPLTDIIDMHGHLGNWSWHIPDTTIASMVAVMDRLGVQSIVCSHMQCMGAGQRRGNREVLAAMRAFPGRILGYLIVWPWPEPEVRAEVARCLDDGFVGVKMHNFNGFPYNHPSYAPAYQAAEERSLPLLFHTWSQEREFTDIDEVARRCPNASILLAHTRPANGEGYLRLAREHPNVFLETTLSACPRGWVERLVAEVGADKVVWGSDMYCFSQPHQIGKVLGARISDEDKIKILSGNAKRILARRAQ